MLSNHVKDTFSENQLEKLAALRSEADNLKIDQQSINLFMQAPVGICILKGSQFIITLANDPILNLWGKSKNVIGKAVIEALPEIAGQGYIELLEKVMAAGEPVKAYEREVTLLRNGIKEIVFVNFLYQPYFEADGQVTGVLVIAMEVTESVVSRKKIEDSETKLRNIIEQTPSPILILKGEDMVLEVANQPLFDLWNVGPEAIGKPFLQILPEMANQVFLELLKNVFTTGETFYGYETPAVFHRKSGIKETVYVNFVYQPYRLKDGTITGIIVLASDVTEQVIAKQELVQSEARNRLAVETARLGTYEVNIADRTLHHNERTAVIFGFPANQKIAYDVLNNSIHPDDIEIRSKAHELAKETGELRYEARIILHDNTICWVRLNGKFISKENPDDLLIGTVLDITDEKRAAELLEQKINERTKELLLANAQLEKTNDELEQFSHVSSHDLQEPLRKITLFTNMILNQGTTDLDDNTKKNLDKVKESAGRMSASLSALLNYTQLKKIETFTDIDLNEIFAGIISDLEMLISDKNAKVTFDKLPVIKGIPHQIQQLFYNLVNNALKFSKTDVTPVISIKVNQADGSAINSDTNTHQNYWELVIEDNGVGFEQKFSEKIFTMFQRLHNRQSYSGTGIGLALCKKVVENHKGRIWAFSEVNKGSKFHVLLPQMV